MDHVDDRSRVSRTILLRAVGAGSRILGLGLVFSIVEPWTSAGEGDQPGAKAQVAAVPPAANPEGRRVLDVHHAASAEADSIARARQMIADCKARYLSVHDYTCTFFKRERVDGRLYEPHVMQMKARTHPSSLYFKFVEPNKGREAIYVHGRNNNKIIAHDVGLGRVVAGTMHLDPRGTMAMEENRHPVSEAGIGNLIDNVQHHWSMELTPANTQVVLHPQAKVGDRACTMIETTHPRRGPQFLFHKVKLYIDKEFNLPIRFEAYDWPARAGAEPLLMEEYTYSNLRLNVGLKERDFDHNNAQYSYGRF